MSIRSFGPITTNTRPQKGVGWAARLVWVILLLMTIWKISLGLPLYIAEVRSICTASEEVCRLGNSLTPFQVEVLESRGFTLSGYAILDLVWKIITSLIWAGVGIFIFLLRPNDRLAWIASAMMIVFNSAGYETQIMSAYPAQGAVAEFLFNLGNALLFLFIGLFPNGKYSPGWMRWYWSGMVFLSFLPIRVWLPNPPLYNGVLVFFWVSFLILGPYSQIYKYRNESTIIERQQTRWIVLGFTMFAGAVLVGFSLLALFPEMSLGQIIYQTFIFDLVALFIPLNIAISILRYRLWDIDVVIRRTLQYALLTATLALAYFGAVVVLQGLFGQITGESGSPLITVISTLAIAALFTPLRTRTQAFIDRRFFRQKYNAEQILARFAAAARDEVDLEALNAALLGAVAETMQPERVSLLMKTRKTRE